MNKKSQHWTLLGVVLVLSLLLGACGQVPVTGDENIKIGAALCLTGIQAPLDEPALKGAQLAVEEINKKGGVLGKQLELINLDCKSDPVTTGNVAVQLIDQGAQAIIAPSDFDFGGPASREAQKAGLVGISPAASSPFYGSEALGDKRGIRRFGDALVPLDEALVQCAVDVSGRPYCVHTGEPDAQAFVQIGGTGAPYVGSLTRHVFETLAFHAQIALHVRVISSRDRTTSSRRSSRRSPGRCATPWRSTRARRVCRPRRALCDA